MSLNPLREEPSFRTLPSNRSLVVADSVYRDIEDENQSAFDFVCALNGGLEGKELIYERLYWNQPIYSHTNRNNELLFQINGDDTRTYVIYATPYLMFTQFDGNPNGTSYLPPQLGSYASNIELALNGDVREMPLNATPINGGTGILKDANGFTMTPIFRYSPSRGFMMSFQASTNPAIPCYTFRILPCSFIEFGHYVHGFGISSPTNANSSFIPKDMWTTCYISDDTPTLLPFRFITIKSNDLVKDRRMMSFQNSNSAKALNELAIFSLNSAYTGSYHLESVGDDATVISKRDDYRPEKFRISILNEFGDVIICDDLIGGVLQSEYVYNVVKNSFLFGARMNRGDFLFTNYLLFGTPSYNIPNETDAVLDLSTAAPPTGASGFCRNNATFDIPVNTIPWQSLTALTAHQYAFPITGVIQTQLPLRSGNTIGFGQPISTATPSQWGWSQSNYPTPPGEVGVNMSEFLYSPSVNPTPSISFDGVFTIIRGNNTRNSGPNPNVIQWIIGIYSFTRSLWLAAAYSSTAQNFWITDYWDAFPPFSGTVQVQFRSTDDPIVMESNPYLSSSVNPDNQTVGFFAIPLITGTPNKFDNKWSIQQTFDGSIPSGQRMIIGVGSTVQATARAQRTYMDPVVDPKPRYPFGNPQATALCEEVIHELAIVAKNN